MKNSYEISADGTTATIWIKRRTGERIACLIDAEDLPKVETIPNTWCASWNPNARGFYVHRNVTVGRKHTTFTIHRFITDAPKGLQVDHRNHDTLDNRRSNLRVTTHSGNQMNRRGANRDNKMGHRGIRRRGSKFELRVRIDGKVEYIGLFATLDEAVAVRDQFPGYGKKPLRHSEVSA
jgi:hypothetical protein